MKYDDAEWYELTNVLDQSEFGAEQPEFTMEQPQFAVDQSQESELRTIKLERVPNKVERVLPGPIQKRRPGRQPARPDSELDAVEFDRRQRRRERNRVAAARCRNKRLTKVAALEEEIGALNESKTELQRANESLKAELNRLRLQIELQQQKPAVVARAPNNCEMTSSDDDAEFPALKALENLQCGSSGYAVSFTPLVLDKSFEFPTISNNMRLDSVSEFEKVVTAL